MNSAGIPALAAMFGWELKPHGNQRSPLRDERTPSFSVFDDGHGWKDHGLGIGGDGVAFVMAALKCDHAGARDWWMERYGIDVLDGVKNSIHPRKTSTVVEVATIVVKRIEWPELLAHGNASTRRKFAEIRGLSHATVNVLMHSRMLGFLTVDGHECFAVLDPENRSAEIRRIDRGNFGKSKAYPLKGVDKSWPLGLHYAKGSPKDCGILLCEGATDFLTAMDLYTIHRKAGGKPWVPCALLGASCKTLHPEAERIMRGRTVQLVPDGDEAGDKMADHWRELLLGIGCTVTVVKLPRGRDLSDERANIQPGDLYA